MTDRKRIEMELIGAIVFNSKIMDEVFAILPNPEAFTDPDLRRVYIKILKIYETTSDFNQLSIVAELDMGLKTLAVEAREKVATSTHAQRHAEIIANIYRKKQIVIACKKAIDQCGDDSTPGDDIIEGLEGATATIDQPATTPQEPIGSEISDYIDRLVTGKGKRSNYLTTHIPELNKKIVGLFPGEMIIVAGPPSMGKTSLILETATFNSRKGKKILFVSLDQTKGAVYDRIIASTAGLPIYKLTTNGLSQQEIAKVVSVGTELMKDRGLFVCDPAGLSARDIKVIARRIKHKHGLDAIIVDYLQQVRWRGRADSRTMEITYISGEMKDMAKELNVAVIVLSQLNRTYENLKDGELPRMSMLRDSGALEQDANLILFPWIPLQFIKTHYGENSKQYLGSVQSGEDPRAKIIIAKYKDGPTGIVECYWKPEKMSFYTKPNFYMNQEEEDRL